MAANKADSWQSLLYQLSSDEETSSFDPSSEYAAVKSLFNCKRLRSSLKLWLQELNTDSVKNSYQKSESIASLLKQEGNTLFNRRDYMSSIVFYNKALACAPINSTEYFLTLGNRAAALIKIEYYQRALLDLMSAYHNDYPKEKRYKIFNKLAQCHFNLDNHEQGVVFCEKALHSVIEESGLSKAEIDPIQNALSQMKQSKILYETKSKESEPRVISQNKHLNGASGNVKLSYSNSKGRHISAKCDLKKGDVIFEELPFALVSLPVCDMSNVSCDNCGLVVKNQFSCDTCVHSHYCSSNCKHEAWNQHHQWECKGYSMMLWQSIGIIHLASRVVLIASNYNFNLENQSKIFTTAESLLNYLNSIEYLQPGVYGRVFHLVTNLENIDKCDLKQYTMASLMILTYFFEYTSLFEGLQNKFKNISLEELQLFIGCLLLKHLCQMICNSSVIIDEATNNHTATGIYPSSSMMNHSCSPNTFNRYYGGKFIVQAAIDIMSGSEVYNCYGLQSDLVEREERRRLLKYQYGFDCTCESCNIF